MQGIASGTQWHLSETTRTLFRVSPSGSVTSRCHVRSPLVGMIRSCLFPMRRVCPRDFPRAISMSLILDTLFRTNKQPRRAQFMRSAKQLLQAYIDGSAKEAAALFAENGALELPY